ncbi:hypothetical protein ACOKFD_06365 [Flagellimonas sp. S174]
MDNQNLISSPNLKSKDNKQGLMDEVVILMDEVVIMFLFVIFKEDKR